MKSATCIHTFVTFLGGAILLASAPVRAGTAPSNPGLAPTMFMGLDLSIPHQGSSLTILDATDNELIISVDGATQRVPTSGRNVRLQFKHSLKLSDGAATIERLEAAPGYSPTNDPYRKFNRSAGVEGGVAAAMDQASAGLRGSEMAYAAATGVINSGAYAPGAEAAQAAAQAAMDASYAQMNQVGLSGMSAQNTTGTYDQQLREELAEENHDALDVAFEVSSPVPLSTPWIAVLLKYRNRDQPQAEPLTWIVTKALAPIGPQATRVRFKQTGLPVGFKMESYQIHLFNKGQEIATTEAPMRTTLTAEEAFQYRVIDYVTTHADATLPAAPAGGQVSDPLREHLTTRYANKPVYVRVLPTGRAERAFADKACKTPLEDVELDTLLSLMRFDPALEKGKPVKGVVMLVGRPS